MEEVMISAAPSIQQRRAKDSTLLNSGPECQLKGRVCCRHVDCCGAVLTSATYAPKIQLYTTFESLRNHK